MKTFATRQLLAILTIFLAVVSMAATEGRVEQLGELLTDESRPAGDKERDDGRKPAHVIAFLGIEPGMAVLDLFASGGYYTEVLSKAVGESGKVYCQNNPGALERRGGAAEKMLSARLDGRLDNVERVDKPVRELDIPAGSLDAITFILNFHDVYNNDPEASVRILEVLSGLLKPNGFIALVDHVGEPGNDNASLHRVDPAAVRKAVSNAGLKIAAESDLLANPDDDHSKMVFNPDIRGYTDRFLFKVVK